MWLIGGLVKSVDALVEAVADAKFDTVKPKIAPVACGQSGVRSPGVKYGKKVIP